MAPKLSITLHIRFRNPALFQIQPRFFISKIFFFLSKDACLFIDSSSHHERNFFIIKNPSISGHLSSLKHETANIESTFSVFNFSDNNLEEQSSYQTTRMLGTIFESSNLQGVSAKFVTDFNFSIFGIKLTVLV